MFMAINLINMCVVKEVQFKDLSASVKNYANLSNYAFFLIQKVGNIFSFEFTIEVSNFFINLFVITKHEMLDRQVYLLKF